MSAAAPLQAPPSGGAPHAGATRAFSRVMAFLCDDVTRQAVLRIAADSGWRQPLVEGGGVTAAIEHLTGGLSPELLFVDLAESDNPLADVNALADVCDAGTRVIAFGTANDVKLYRGLVAAGVVDYLLKPVNPADILRAIAEAAGTATEARPTRRGRLMLVAGTRGGVGASTVASSLAWLAAESFGARTALLDLDLRFGTGALAFDAEPGTGLADMLADPDRIDPLFLERGSVAATERLALYATEAPLAAAPLPRPDALKVLTEELLRTYDWVVADVPRDTLAGQPDLISVADVAVLVSDLSLAAMRDALRLRTVIAEHGPHTRLRLLENQTRPAAKGELPRAEFERTVGLDFGTTLPLDRRAVCEQEGRGRPLAAGRGRAASVLARFAREFFEPEETAAKPVRWSFGFQIGKGGRR